jgi:hypothetical protein
MVGDVRRGLLVLFAGVVAVLLVARVKVGSLSRARRAVRIDPAAALNQAAR